MVTRAGQLCSEWWASSSIALYARESKRRRTEVGGLGTSPIRGDRVICLRGLFSERAQGTECPRPPGDDGD